MKLNHVILGLCLLIQGSLKAQSPQSQQILEDVKDRVAFGKKLILSNLTPQEQSVANQINVRVVESNDPGRVRAFKQNGANIIEVSTAFARTMVPIVDAMQHLPSRQALEYIHYLVTEQKANLERFQKGASMRAVKDPFEWANVSKETRDAIFTSPNRATDDRLVTGVIAFALAHEYGHHLKGHTDAPPDSKGRSRQQEAEADQWASEAMLRADVGPIVGVYAFLYYAELDCDAIRNQSTRTHPADITRLQGIVNMTLKGLPRLKIQGDREKMENGLKYLLANLQTQIAESISCLSSMNAPGIAPKEPPEDIQGSTFKNNPEAAKLLTYGSASSKLNWHTNGNPPIVEFNLTYMNQSDTSLTGIVTVLSGHVSRSNANDGSNWEQKYKKNFSFVVSSGEKMTVSGVLPWYREENTMPQIRYPRPPTTEMALLRCDFLPGSQPLNHSAAGPTTLDSFAKALRTIAEAAGENFNSIRGAKIDSDETSEDFVCKVTLPDSSQGHISIDKEDHSASAFFTILDRTKDSSAAEATYESIRNRIATALGKGWDNAEASPSKSATTKKTHRFVSNKASIRLNWYQYKAGDNRIVLSVSPR